MTHSKVSGNLTLSNECEGELTHNSAWYPPRGIDPLMVQFSCNKCGSILYIHKLAGEELKGIRHNHRAYRLTRALRKSRSKLL